MGRMIKKVLVYTIAFSLTVSGMTINTYGQSIDESRDKIDPFEMMKDTTPELMTAEEIIKAAYPASMSQAVIDTVNPGLKVAGYHDFEELQQIIKDTVVNLNCNENDIELDLHRLDDIFKHQQDLVDQSKTDRFIVKYKKGKEDSFKKKAGKEIQDSHDIRNLMPDEFKSGSDNDSERTLLDSVGEFMKESVNGIDFPKGNQAKTELLILEEKINPAEFAKLLKERGVEGEIEYIQPDFRMELNSIDGLSIDIIEEQADEPANEPNLNEDPSEELVIDEIVTEEAITTEEAIEELLPKESQYKVMVAVIDTGLDITHPDLEEFIYVNQNEIPDNGIDDDGNGYIDDINGWSFSDNSGVVYDESLGLDQAHGTHIAGIIAGLSNADDNLIPNDNIEILPLKVFNNGIAYTSDIIAAIEYAERMGAKVVNCSFGSTNDNPALKEAIENSEILFICSAGNARTDLDITPIYPACFDLDNIISVTSTNADGGLSYFSNYSSSLVDVAALGRDISSTLPNGEYGLQSGTSMSTALVSGVTVAVLNVDNSLDPAECKERLLDTSDKLSNLQEVVNFGRQINVSNAIIKLEQADVVENSPESDFNVIGYNPTQAELYQLYSSSSVIQVSAGDNFSLVLKNDGTVWSWGSNDSGECGNGLTTDSVALTQVVGLTNVVSIAAGYAHSLTLKSDGTIWAWGSNGYGQLGDGTRVTRTTPVQVSGLTDIVSISAGGTHSLALKSDGTVWAWGSNYYRQLGNSTTALATSPVQVSGLMDVVSIAAGYAHSLAVKSDGTVWAWGSNNYGQLGDGTTTTRTAPVQVGGLIGVVSAAGGRVHSLAVKSDGTVWSWGSNINGEIGDATRTTRQTPVQVIDLTSVVSVAAGVHDSLAVKSDGTVWAWGSNNYGQLGDGTTTTRTAPVQVGGLIGVVSAAWGRVHSLAVKSDGTVWSWGYNDYGQLGDGKARIRTTPVQVNGLTDIVGISAGEYYSLTLKSDGSVWAWGYNNYGQLGNGTTELNSSPVQVSGLMDVVSIAAGSGHSLAVKSDGTVWAWGSNDYGQLGDGTVTNRTTPVQVSDLNDVVNIAAGAYHSLAIGSYGSVFAWGSNDYGQLGEDGTVTNRTTPVQVSDLTDVVSIAAGFGHSLALKSDRTVWAWGLNYCGQLGDGTTFDRPMPEQVGLNDVVNIAAGYDYSLAAKSDAFKSYGTVWSWGENSYGQLGDGTKTLSMTPVQVNDLYDIVSVGAGCSHSLAVESDGTLWAWGCDDSGQLGQSRISQSSIPIQCQTYVDVFFSFEQSNYTAVIPTINSNTIMASAIGNDTYGNVISASSITYSLARTYVGVTINSTTGAITITPSAQAGSVQVKATYHNLTCNATLILTVDSSSTSFTVNATSGNTYYIDLSVSNISSFSGKYFSLNYDSNILETIDLCAYTDTKETTAGVIKGTGITITSVSGGSIVMTVDRTIPDGKQWSGVITIIKFRAKTTGQTDLAAEYN